MADHSQPIIWSSDALADRSEIWDYYRKVAGRHHANKIIRDIHQACLLLEDHPFAGRAVGFCRGGCRSQWKRHFCVETLEDAMARHGKPEIFNKWPASALEP